MKGTLYSIIAALVLCTIAPVAQASPVAVAKETTLTITTGENAVKKRVKKRKLKKIVRKTGRIYRDVKPDRESKKKSRKIQRNVRRIINIL